MTKAQQRLQALKLQRALPPLIHGGVAVVNEPNANAAARGGNAAGR